MSIGWLEGIIIFSITWWMILFMVLPFGVRSQAENGDYEPGTDPGAPTKAYLGRKILITTLIAIPVSVGIALAVSIAMGR